MNDSAGQNNRMSNEALAGAEGAISVCTPAETVGLEALPPAVRGGLPATMAVAFGAFTIVTSEFLPIGLLPRISGAFHVSDGTAGFMVTVTGLVAAFAAPALSVASGRIDRRWMIFGLTGLLVLSNLMVATARVFPVALAARILLGITVGGFWTIGPSLAPRFVGAQAVPKAVAIITAGVSIGTVAGLPVGELVGHLTSWRVAFVGTAALGLVALALEVRFLPPLPSSRSVRLSHLIDVARTPAARIGLVAAGLTVGGNFAAYTFVTPYLEQNAHISAGWVSVVLVGYGTTSIAGNFVAGATIGRSITKTLLVSTFIMMTTIALLTVVTPWAVAVVVLLGVWGVSWGASPVILQTWMMKAAPGAHEEGLSLFMFVVQLSLAGGSLGGGLIVNSFGILWSFGAGAAIALLAGITIVAMLRSAGSLSWQSDGDDLFGELVDPHGF